MATMYDTWCRSQGRNPAIWDLVYRSYTPQTVGVVLGSTSTGEVEVRWVTSAGAVTGDEFLPARRLLSLDALIAETETRLSGHRARRKRALVAAGGV